MTLDPDDQLARSVRDLRSVHEEIVYREWEMRAHPPATPDEASERRGALSLQRRVRESILDEQVDLLLRHGAPWAGENEAGAP